MVGCIPNDDDSQRWYWCPVRDTECSSVIGRERPAMSDWLGTLTAVDSEQRTALEGRRVALRKLRLVVLRESGTSEWRGVHKAEFQRLEREKKHGANDRRGRQESSNQPSHPPYSTVAKTLVARPAIIEARGNRAAGRLERMTHRLTGDITKARFTPPDMNSALINRYRRVGRGEGWFITSGVTTDRYRPPHKMASLASDVTVDFYSLFRYSDHVEALVDRGETDPPTRRDSSLSWYTEWKDLPRLLLWHPTRAVESWTMISYYGTVLMRIAFGGSLAFINPIRWHHIGHHRPAY